jgi:hypothetical protein
MKDGRVEAEGTLDELLETSEEMQRLWKGKWKNSSSVWWIVGSGARPEILQDR